METTICAVVAVLLLAFVAAAFTAVKEDREARRRDNKELIECARREAAN